MSEAYDFDQALDALAALEDESSSINTTEEAAGAGKATEEATQESTQDDPDLEADGEDGQETVAGDAEDGEDDLEEDGQETVAIDAPEYWDDEQKALFASWDPEVQKTVSENLKKSEVFMNTKVQNAVLAQQAAAQEAKALNAIRVNAEQQLEQSSMVFANKWTNFPWQQIRDNNPEQFAQYQRAYELESKQLGDLKSQYDNLMQVGQAQFLKEESEALQGMAVSDPLARQLVDQSETGAKLRSSLQKYVLDLGVPESRLGMITAKEMVTALKAMKYDALMAREKAAKAGANTAQAQNKSTQKPVKRAPVAASKHVNRSQAAQARKAFEKAPTLEAALELMNLTDNR